MAWPMQNVQLINNNTEVQAPLTHQLCQIFTRLVVPDPNGNQGTIRHLYLQMLAIATSRYDPSTQGGALVTVFHGRHSLDLNITMLHLSQACNAGFIVPLGPSSNLSFSFSMILRAAIQWADTMTSASTRCQEKATSWCRSTQLHRI